MLSPYFSPLAPTEQKPYPLPDDPKLVLALLTELAADISNDEKWLTAVAQPCMASGAFEVRLAAKAFDLTSAVQVRAGDLLDNVIAELRMALEHHREIALSGRAPFRKGYPLPFTEAS